MKLVFSSHVALIDGKEYDGIGNSLKKTLDDTLGEYTFIRNSMDGRLHSEIQRFDDGKMVSSKKLPVIQVVAPLRYLTEVFSTVWAMRKEEIDAYIGIDPLNALAAIYLKKVGRVKSAVFFTADYSENRFDNVFLNNIYHMIDRYCVRRADQVWCVSSRIMEVREKMGAPNNKCVYVPNVPPLAYDKFLSSHNKYELVTSGIIDRQLDFENVFYALKSLEKKYPKLRFTIIGNGPDEGRLKKLTKKLGVEKKVEFTGKLPLDECLRREAEAGIGLALYTGVWGFNQYGDSTKCREFFNYGLPVISTDTHSTVEDIRHYSAGVIVEKRAEDYAVAIDNILSQYDKYSVGSLKLGKKYSGAHRTAILNVVTQ